MDKNGLSSKELLAARTLGRIETRVNTFLESKTGKTVDVVAFLATVAIAAVATTRLMPNVFEGVTGGVADIVNVGVDASVSTK